MEEKKNFFDFAENVLCTFGFMMILMMIFTFAFGEETRTLSTMFRLGGSGIALATMCQYLGLAILITGIRFLFFSERAAKYMPELYRICLMLLCSVLVIVLFIILFKWFPVQMWQAWVMFVLCFAICFWASVWIMSVKNRMENEKLEESLEYLKERWKEDQDGERD